MPTFAHLRSQAKGKPAMVALAAIALATLWLADARVGRLWLNTAMLACEASLIAIPIGTVLALLIFKTDVPGRRPALWLVVGMLFVPLYLVTGAWDAGFGIQGWHTLFTNPHLAHLPWLAGWRAAVWVHAFAAVPWVVLIVGAGLRTVEAEIEEDASTCAAPWQVLWHISLRRALPAIGIASLWIGTIVLTEISVTDFFQVRTFAEEVYTQSALGALIVAPAAESTEPIPAAGLWTGLLLSTLIAGIVMASTARFMVDLADAPARDPWLWRLKSKRVPVALLLLFLLVLCVGIPVGNLVFKAGVHVSMTDAGRVRSWSLLQAAEVVANAPYDFRGHATRSDFSGEIWLSTQLGVAVATSVVALAIPLAWFLCQSKWKIRLPIMLLIAICLTLPGPLLGLAVIHMLDQPPTSPLSPLAELYDSNFAPWLVQVLRALPLATLILWAAFASIPQVMLDAAMTDGADWWRRLALIALPQRKAAIVAAWLVAFAIAVGELAATVLVMPPQVGKTALSIRVFQLLHFGVDDRVAAISLVMIAGFAALSGIAGVLLKRKERWLRNAPMSNDA